MDGNVAFTQYANKPWNSSQRVQNMANLARELRQSHILRYLVSCLKTVSDFQQLRADSSCSICYLTSLQNEDSCPFPRAEDTGWAGFRGSWSETTVPSSPQTKIYFICFKECLNNVIFWRKKQGKDALESSIRWMRHPELHINFCQ